MARFKITLLTLLFQNNRELLFESGGHHCSGAGIRQADTAGGPLLGTPRCPAVRYLLLDTDLVIMRRLLIVPLLLCLVGAMILFSGCTSEDSAPSASLPPSPSTAPGTSTTHPAPDFIVGEKKETVPTLATSRLVISLYSISGWNSSSPLLHPGAGNEYVVVDFSLRNVGYPEGYLYRPESVTLMDSSRTQYRYHDASFSLVNGFREATIPINETRRGRLVFEVPIAPAGTEYMLSIAQ